MLINHIDSACTDICHCAFITGVRLSQRASDCRNSIKEKPECCRRVRHYALPLVLIPNQLRDSQLFLSSFPSLLQHAQQCAPSSCRWDTTWYAPSWTGFATPKPSVVHPFSVLGAVSEHVPNVSALLSLTGMSDMR
jgi:hypothetical protein